MLMQSIVARIQTSSMSLKGIKSIKDAHKRGIKIGWHAINCNQLFYNIEGLISITMKKISVDGFRVARTRGTTRRTQGFERRGLNVGDLGSQ
jgi:hypothetical protein